MANSWILWSRDDDSLDLVARREQLKSKAADSSTRTTRTSGAPAATLTGSRVAAPAHSETTLAPPELAGDAALIDSIIATGSVEVLFQPVVDVLAGQVVGFEALARGPEGPLRAPDRLFAAARKVGRGGELDWVCRATAFRTFLDSGLHPSLSLFVNVEPDSLIEPCPEDLLPTIWEAERRLRVFIDLTGRALARHPAAVLETVRRARAARWGVAVDDLEFSAVGLALLPVIEPDVVKLDHRLLSSGYGHAPAALLGALAEVQQTGASLLVYLVEDQAASAAGRCIGARYQQGYHFGRGEPVPHDLPAPTAPMHLRGAAEDLTTTPFALLRDAGSAVTDAVPTAELGHLVRVFQTQASRATECPVVVSLLPKEVSDGSESRALLRVLLERSPLLLLLGTDVAEYDGFPVRTGVLPHGHALSDEVCFLALSPGMAIVIAARRKAGQAGAAVWEVATSQDASVCRHVMRSVLSTMDELEGGVRYES